MNSYNNDLHSKYVDLISSFLNNKSLNEVVSASEIDAFFRVCALTVWKAGNVNPDDIKDSLEQIYVYSSDKQIYTISEVKEALSNIDYKNIDIIIPSFFKEIVKYDLKNNVNASRMFASGSKYIMLLFAMSDLKVNERETFVINKFSKLLVNYCDKNNVIPYDDEVNVNEYINEKTDENYPKQDKTEDEIEKSEVSLESAYKELNGLIGLDKVKNDVKSIANFINVQKMRKQMGLPNSPVSYHLVFTGNPGTGKTTVARILASIYKGLGVVSKGQLVEVSRSDLVAGYVGQTATKTKNVIQSALGGVLFIDEAYTLESKNEQDFGQEAIDTLLKEMEDHRNDLVVIAAGYDKQMDEFINSNPGLKSRFSKYIHFDDYSPKELFEIFKSQCLKNKYELNDEYDDKLIEYFKDLKEKKNTEFGNAREIRNYFEVVIQRQANRVSMLSSPSAKEITEITDDDLKIEKNKEETLDDVLKDLNSLIGLDEVKSKINDQIILVKNQKNREKIGLKVTPISLHMVFSGNPGTGKTTVARLVGRIYKHLGMLDSGQLIETDRSSLVAGYVGQTAIKTKNVIQKALGGVLFIDEAYTLSNGSDNDFGQEAIDTLLKEMEDNRSNLVVIVAGYKDLMKKFINSNPGLESRFNNYIYFDDYSPEEKMLIFDKLCKDNQYLLNDDAKDDLLSYFGQQNCTSNGNGREVRNVFEKVIVEQAKRLANMDNLSEEDARLITISDINLAVNNHE